MVDFSKITKRMPWFDTHWRIGHNQCMIRSFRRKGLREFFETGKTQRIHPAHHKRLIVRLDTLNHAAVITDLDQPGWDLHELKGNRAGVWSIRVTGNWRLTFRFEPPDCFDVDYEDYH